MKKLLVLSVVAVLTVFVFAGCTKAENKTDLPVNENAVTVEDTQVQNPVQEVPEETAELATAQLTDESPKAQEKKPVENITEKPAKTPEVKVTKEEAKATVLRHSGLAEAEISRYKAELDRERNGLVYEIEFDAGKYEYDYEVDAETGKVLKAEKEFRD